MLLTYIRTEKKRFINHHYRRKDIYLRQVHVRHQTELRYNQVCAAPPVTLSIINYCFYVTARQRIRIIKSSLVVGGLLTCVTVANNRNNIPSNDFKLFHIDIKFVNR